MLGSSSFPHWRYLIVISVGSASVPYRWSQPWKPFFFLSAHLRLVWKRQNWLVWCMLLVAKQHLFKVIFLRCLMPELTCGGSSKWLAFTSVSSSPSLLKIFHFPSLLGTPLLNAWVNIYSWSKLSILFVPPESSVANPLCQQLRSSDWFCNHRLCWGDQTQPAWGIVCRHCEPCGETLIFTSILL